MILAQSNLSLSITLWLAVVATIGYLVGRRRVDVDARARNNSRHEIMRALAVAQELETIAYRLRKSMAFHVPAIVRFNNKVHRWERSNEISWHELCEQADDLLKPALRLSTEISHAYADLLQQMTQLSAFAELTTDPLTGVANRRAFDDSLEKLLAVHLASEAPLSVAMLDLDRFKRINDEGGHLAGDRVLQELTQLVKPCLREGDLLARFGGEEFAILMPQTPAAAAAQLAERVRARVADKLATTVSIGVATTAAVESANSLLSRADKALYAAKDQGRNRVCRHEGPPGRVSAVASSPGSASNAVVVLGDGVASFSPCCGDSPAAL